MTEQMTARKLAVELLSEVLFDGAYSNLALKKRLPALTDSRDRSLCTELVYGVLQWDSLLCHYINAVASTKTERMKPEIRLILETAVYQLLYLDKIPAEAACNEAVKLTRACCGKNQALPGFVNGVLRAVLRMKEHLPPLNEPTKEDYYAKAYSLPRWITSMWIEQYGLKTTKELCAACNQRRETVIRCNSLKTDENGLLMALAENGITPKPIEGLKQAYTLHYSGDLGNLKAYREGLMTAQDIGSQLAVAALAPKPGATLLDLCSAPGGKAVLAAQYMANTGMIRAFDLHPHKVELIKKNAARMGVTVLQTACKDMTVFYPELSESADFVLCDVPCSGLGIIAKKPDIRYKAKTDAELLPPVQLQILKNALRYVKKGGSVLYSTCTLNKHENEEVVLQALNEMPGFEQVPFHLDYQNIESDGMLTLLPHVYHSDGFFICKLRRAI